MFKKTSIAVAAAFVLASASAAVADIDTDVSLYRGTLAGTYYGQQRPADSALAAQAKAEPQQVKTFVDSIIW